MHGWRLTFGRYFVDKSTPILAPVKNILSKNVGVRGSSNSDASVVVLVVVGDADDVATDERMSTKTTKFSI